MLSPNYFNLNLKCSNILDYSKVFLSEDEENILFMLINNRSPKQIAEFLEYNLADIQKIISYNLFMKFQLTSFSITKLIEKAVAMGYEVLVPNIFYLESTQKKYFKYYNINLM